MKNKTNMKIFEKKRAHSYEIQGLEVKLKVPEGSSVVKIDNLSFDDIVETLSASDNVSSHSPKLFDLVDTIKDAEGSVPYVDKDGKGQYLMVGVLAPSIKIHKDIKSDISLMASVINRELMDEVVLQIERSVMKEIQRKASESSPVKDKDMVMALRESWLQIRSIGGNMSNCYILMNPVDVIKAKQDKSAFVSIHEDNKLKIFGTEVVETSLIAAGEYIVGNFDKAKLYVGKDIDFNIMDGFGSNNNDTATAMMKFKCQCHIEGRTSPYFVKVNAN